MMRTIITFSIVMILMSACKDEDIINSPDQTSTQASQDHLFAENIFNDINRIVEDGFNVNGLNKSSCVNYKTIATDSSDADTLIINYGDNDCLDEYGKIRRGKIIVIYTAPYQEESSQTITTFDQYYMNSTDWIQGSRIMTNNGTDNDGNIIFDVLIDVNISTEIGRIDWISNRTRYWVNGYETILDPFDDIYKIVGSSNGNGLNDRDFTVNITDTLMVKLECISPIIPFDHRCMIVSGKAEIKPEEYPVREINYGMDECDCNFSVSVNNDIYTIVVP